MHNKQTDSPLEKQGAISFLLAVYNMVALNQMDVEYDIVSRK